MPATDYQGSSTPFASFGRSILSIRRDQVANSMESHPGGSVGSSQERELESFQNHVAILFQDLATAIDGDGNSNSDGDLLSLRWIRKLLEAFLICQEQFRAILLNNRALMSRPPLDRMVGEYFERSVKALDVCNAIRDGIEQIRQWQKLLEIVFVALDPRHQHRAVGEGQCRRARRALTDLTIAMLDEKDSSVVAHRNRSFGRTTNKDHHQNNRLGHFRSLSWSVSRSWSAARQLQAIGNNISAPRGSEIVATGGIAVAVYTMNMVLLFAMWALVAAIPCQDRGLQIHFSAPRNFSWGAPIASLHERIVEESKKRLRRNSNGLLREIHQIERCSRQLADLTDVIQSSGQYPPPEEREAEMRQGLEELAHVCDALKDGLDPLERQVREVFHRIVRSRTECLDCLGQSTI